MNRHLLFNVLKIGNLETSLQVAGLPVDGCENVGPANILGMSLEVWEGLKTRTGLQLTI